jgi:diguanylate cyclase (GGDEF)-like protein/PAS domain S-box-containing protein
LKCQPDKYGVLGAAERAVMERLPVASYIGPIAGGGSVSYVTPELESLLGYRREAWSEDPRFWSKLIHTDDRARVLAERAHFLEAGQRFVSEYRVTAGDGRVIWLRDEAVVAREQPSGSAYQHGVMIDITERKAVEEALEHEALHDSLTELPNRTLFLDRLRQAIVGARRDTRELALLLIDLDRFKEINDTFGHQYGDLLLRQVVAQLRGVLRESDTVARLGGDEFAILLPGADRRAAEWTVSKILQVLGRPFNAEGHVLDTGASVGIALFPDHGQDAHGLLQRADVAMYGAKRSESTCVVYEAHRDPYSPSRLSLVRELRAAIENDGLILHYQPKTQLKTGCSRHVEALVRWNHPERGLVPPEEFIAVAEHAGLMKKLSLWVMNAALKQCHEWHVSRLDISVAVNISARTLHDPKLIDQVQELLRKWDVAPRWLEVEITEGALMADPPGALRTLTRLHEMGVCISIDDFGTGYSSLSYLTKLPADQIKIDKSFVLDMAQNDDSAFIVRSVIDLGHNLSLEVVAEGVENQETWDLLEDMGCDVAQGYLLSRPVSATEIEPMLAASEARLLASKAV